MYSPCLQPPVGDAFCIQRSIVIPEAFGLGDNRQFKVAQQLLSLILSSPSLPIPLSGCHGDSISMMGWR